MRKVNAAASLVHMNPQPHVNTDIGCFIYLFFLKSIRSYIRRLCHIVTLQCVCVEVAVNDRGTCTCV